MDCPQHENGAGGEDEECCGSGCGSGDEETITTTTITSKITSTTTEQYTCQDGSMIPITKVCNLYRPIHSSHSHFVFSISLSCLFETTSITQLQVCHWVLRLLSLIVENVFVAVWQYHGLPSTWKWAWRGGRGGLRWWALSRFGWQNTLQHLFYILGSGSGSGDGDTFWSWENVLCHPNYSFHKYNIESFKHCPVPK